jgi:hypothetical protein
MEHLQITGKISINEGDSLGFPWGKLSAQLTDEGFFDSQAEGYNP